MAKVLKTAAMVVGAVALVATGVGAVIGMAGAVTVAGVSTATLTAISGGLSLAAGLLQKKPGFTAEGTPTTFQTNPQSGLPYAMGRTRMSGLRVYAKTYDGFKIQSKHDILGFVAMLSIGGQIEEIEEFTADNDVVTFDSSGNAVGDFDDYMAQKFSLGVPGASALALSFGGYTFPGWTSDHKLSGITHAQWALRFDTDGKKFGAGVPEPAWIGKWVRVYDPRLDSTYPGGSGSCRALDETTYVWSANPGLHALTWALGRWQNGKRTCGIGAPVANIRVGDFVECANVCDANEWTVGGVEWTTDSKWDTYKRILQAGGAVPTMTGAMIGCLVSAPRTSIATIESKHLLDGLTITATKSRRDRFNSVIPRYVSEDHDWSVISGSVVSESAYVAADGGPRTKEIDMPLVQVFEGEAAIQPGQLAAYEIVNSREATITWTTGPEWIGLKTGDVITLDVPDEGLDEQPVLITKRSPDPATGKVSFAAETETYSKHAYALGETTTPPPPFALTPPDLTPPAPIDTDWNLAVTTTGQGQPALIVSGVNGYPSADSILIDYRRTADTDWTSSAILKATLNVLHVIAPLQPETEYEVRIGFRAGSEFGAYTALDPITTNKLGLPVDTTTITAADGSVLATFGELDGYAYIPNLLVDRIIAGTGNSAQFASASTITPITGVGYGTELALLSKTVTLLGPGTIVANAVVAMGYTATPPNCDFYLRIDGGDVYSVGGAETQISVPMAGARYFSSAGTYVVEVIMSAPTSMTAYSRNLSTIIIYGDDPAPRIRADSTLYTADASFPTADSTR